jgi:NADPH:quinone reductase-like Zn-dependent oxidoreductase
MPKAVRFDEYGDVDVLQVVDVERPVPGPGQALIRVRAAAINPGETAIRLGLMHDRWPATFPSGQGSDLAGVVDEVGPGVTGIAVGDEVIGFTHARASHAEVVAVDAANLVPKPAGVPWEVAGSLFVAGTTAWAAVHAVAPQEGETVVVSGAAGGVGSIAVQLAAGAGATVVGLASEPHHGWLRDHGVVPVTYGEGVADRIRRAAGGRVDAVVDTFGTGYVDLAIDLGVGRAPRHEDGREPGGWPPRGAGRAGSPGRRGPPRRSDRRDLPAGRRARRGPPGGRPAHARQGRPRPVSASSNIEAGRQHVVPRAAVRWCWAR